MPRLDLVGGETVLDLACGPGTLTRHLADAVGPDGLVIGADLSPAMLTRAARAITSSNTVFVRADAMALPLRDACVDAVCCSLLLQLVPDLDTNMQRNLHATGHAMLHKHVTSFIPTARVIGAVSTEF